ncbi:MAG: class I SAM-dependent methyltransferase [Sphingobium sp.]
MRLPFLAVFAAGALALAPHAAFASHHKAADIFAAVTAPGRPADAIALDESRKPAEVLAFLGLKPGMTAADLMTGTGYWAEIMSRVVGPKGHVTAFQPTQFYNDAKGLEMWNGLLGRTSNVTLATYPFESFAATPDSFDFAIVNLSYHDLYWESEKYKIPRTDPAAYLKTLYMAMKPGGVVGVIDHVGLPGDTRETVEKFHRIDPDVVKADWTAAGFVLEEESALLRNPADDHSENVFAPGIRGKTDRFLFRFRKPK